ncbi:YpiF family protein [Bacillus xiapuensis]|uniref:YpiF family protein n=1 Tax=Bacillus xiapuensis TaxID=2014075 RepID=UPI0018E221D0|nr:YpiF family protein [Bacillus xiapuensis]
MNWNGKDTELYQQQKEYIDTVMMPLVPVSFSGDMKEAASQFEFIQLLTELLEKQFRGRILLVPPFSYRRKQEGEEKAAALNQWADEMSDAGFRHKFFFTSDSDWKLMEEAIDGTLIWVPSVPLEHMENSYKYSLIEEQAKQFVRIIVHKWQEN